MRWLTKTFLKGVATVLPIALTVASLFWLGRSVEQALRVVFEWVLPDVQYASGLGIAAALVVVMVVGIVMHVGFARRIVELVESLLMRVPFFKSVYGAFRDFLGFFADDGMRKSLSRVVEFDVNGSGHTVMGFVTSDRPSALAEDDGRVTVYVPMSYQIGGFTYFVEPDALTELDIGVEDALRFAMTAGVASADARGPNGRR